MITPYDILTNLVKVKDTCPAVFKKSAISNRMVFICNVLGLKNVEHYIDFFEMYDVPMGNIVCIPKFNGNKKTLIVIAHHDINNIMSENVNDNSASVSHLISLLEYVNNNHDELDVNVIGVFTDNEERGGSGANFLSKQIVKGDYGAVIGVLNLELTACGDVIWKDNIGGFIPTLKDAAQVRTPFNDSHIVHRYGIPTVCIGTLPKHEIEPMLLTERYVCKAWSLCHQIEDDLTTASEIDMTNFQNNLREMVSNIIFAKQVYNHSGTTV